MIGADTLIEIAGWLGAAILLAAYALVSYGAVGGRSGVYQMLNIVSGLLLGANAASHHAWPSTAVNVIWTGIAVGALAVALQPRRAALPDR